MKGLAISNIAWAPSQRFEVYRMLADHGVGGLEIAPGLSFADEADAFAPSDAAVEAWRAEIDDAGLFPVSMQSLLFGVTGAELFGEPAARARFVAGIGRAIDLAGRLGVPNLVMGSPRNRVIPEGMERAEADAIAIDVFGQLGEAAQANGCRLAIEPNPAIYGTNYGTHMAEAAAIVRQVGHPGVTLNFDIGALHVNDEFATIDASLAQNIDIVSHVHVSEPQLAPAPASADHARAASEAVSAAGYAHWVSIEMTAPAGSDLAVIESCVARARAAFADRVA